MELFIALAGLGLGYFLGSLDRDKAITSTEEQNNSEYEILEQEKK